jgi:glycosyltransferase involved in cell wall biosynthesis
LTEVVSVEIEFPQQTQLQTQQQAVEASPHVTQVPLWRPDLKVALVSKFWPSREGVVEYFNHLAKSVSNLCPTVGIANLEQSAPSPYRNGKLGLIQAWRLNSLSYPFQIVRACLRVRPKVVHVNHEYMMYGTPLYGAFMPLLLLMLKIARRPTVLTLHSVIPRGSVWNGFFRRYGSQRLAPLKALTFLAWTMLTLRLANHIIVHSQASKTILSSEYHFPQNNISVVGHGVEPLLGLSRGDAKVFLGFEGKRVVLNLGYLHEKKGLEYLIRSMGPLSKSHPDSLLVIAGGPHGSLYSRPREFQEYVEKLNRIVKESHLEDNVLIRAEYIPEDLLSIYFSSADVVVLPYVEQFGSSGILARAMAAGKPVVATRVNPFFEIIQDGINGLLVDVADSAQLSTAIGRLLDSTPFAESLGSKLKNSARKLLWPDIAKMHVELYSRIAGKSRIPKH